MLPIRLRWLVIRLEYQGGAPRLEHIIRLCRAYNVSLRAMLDGWEGWETGVAPTVMEPAELADLSNVEDRVRGNLKRCRKGRGLSSTQVARAVWGIPSHQSTVLRIEDGKAKWVHLETLYELAWLYKVPLVELCRRVVLQREIEPWPTEPELPQPPPPPSSH